MPSCGDPRAHLGPEWIGKRVRFNHEGKRLTGTVTARKFIGSKGKEPHTIPDYELTIQGRSGKRLTVSMYDTHAIIDP